MRTNPALAVLIALAAVCGPRAAAFQQDVYVTLVHTHFTATDPQGRLVTTLGRNDVTVYDNGVAKPVADFSRPFAGTLSDFNGLTYPQILQLLGGSGGGNWLDVTRTGLSSVEYVRFDVPAGAGDRLVLDAVTAVPEPVGTLVNSPKNDDPCCVNPL